MSKLALLATHDGSPLELADTGIKHTHRDVIIISMSMSVH